MSKKQNNMLTKFIEGTNEQYSIREDGVFIRHYKKKYNTNLKKNIIIYKEEKNFGYNSANAVKVSVRVNEIKKVYCLKYLVAKAFNLYNPYDLKVNCPKAITIAHKDGNFLNCSLDNLYYRTIVGIPVHSSLEEKMKYKLRQKEIEKEKEKRRRIEHREKLNARAKAWRNANLVKCSISSVKTRQKSIKNVNRHYAASKLGIPVALLTDDLYENYKATLLVKRKLAKKLNIKPAHL
jgi:hypothetical protein